MDSAAPKGSFGRHRKIMPFEPGSIEELREGSRQKAASLNQHVLGYGAQAEAEWAAAGIAALWPCREAGSKRFQRRASAPISPLTRSRSLSSQRCGALCDFTA